MKPGHILVTALWVTAASAVFALEAVELDYRLRADHDLVSEQVDENVTTMRVVADRGLVARTAANGARYPLTYHTIHRQRTRFTTGPAQPDGSFAATLAVLSRQASLRLASGEERPVEGQPNMDNFVFSATIDPLGRVLQPTLSAQASDATALDTVKATMASVLEQVTRIAVVRIEPGKAAEQVMNIKVPLPGMAPLDLKINASNRLIEVNDGQARIEMVYVMEFGVREGPVKIEATGTGGGTLHYDIAAKIARRIETNTLMTVLTHVPDGTLELQMNTRQTQQMKDAGQ